MIFPAADLVLETRALGRVLEVHEKIGSTNDRAKELARRGAAHGLAVIAGQQTAGRGQRGRTWTSPPGLGLYVSFVVRPNISTRSAPLLTLTAGLAVFDAVEGTVGLRAQIKWPNDLLARDGRKLAGVLVELAADQMRIDHVVVGIGLNVKDGAWPENAASLEACAPGDRSRIDGAKLFAAIARELEAKLEQAETRGFADIVERVEEELAGRGKPAAMDVDGVQTRGMIAGLAEDGALLLEVNGRATPFHRGQLVFDATKG